MNKQPPKLRDPRIRPTSELGASMKWIEVKKRTPELSKKTQVENSHSDEVSLAPQQGHSTVNPGLNQEVQNQVVQIGDISILPAPGNLLKKSEEDMDIDSLLTSSRDKQPLLSIDPSPSLIYHTDPQEALPHLLGSILQQPTFTFGSCDLTEGNDKVTQRAPVKKQDSRTQKLDRIKTSTNHQSTRLSSMLLSDSDKNSKFSLLWRNPTLAQSREKEVIPFRSTEDLQHPQKRGHRTSLIYRQFWNAIGFTPLLDTSVRRGGIFPQLITCAGDRPSSASFKILC